MEELTTHQEELLRLIENNDAEEIKEYIEDLHPVDISDAMRDMRVEQVADILTLLPVEEQAVIFGYMSAELQVRLSRYLGRKKLARIISEMSGDERTDLYNSLSHEEQKALMPVLSQLEREDIRRLASYPEETVGAIMTSDYAMLNPDLTAREAIDKLRFEAPDKETIYRSYVVDDERRLIGSVQLKDLIVAPPGTLVSEIMEESTPTLNVTDDQEDAARSIARYDMVAMPVIDDEGKIVGIVTHDDAMDVLESEVTEDFHKMAYVGQFTTSVKDAAVTVLYKNRVYWLLLLVFVNIFTGAGIAYFEDTISAYIALVFFLPLLIDSAGNAGSQSATLMIRAMATGEVHMRDWGRLVGKEFLVSFAIGVTMAFAVAFLGIFRGGAAIALVVALSMCTVVIIGSVIGMSLPFLLERFRLDPATASAPLVTSVADAAGVVVYFTIANMILGLPVQV